MKIWKIVAEIEADDEYKKDDLLSYIEHNINSGGGVYLKIESAEIKLEEQIGDNYEKI